MKARPLWRISVSTVAESEDAVVEMLQAVFGCPPAVHQNTLTGRTQVSVFCLKASDCGPARRRQVTEGLRRIRSSGLAVGSGRVRVRRVPAEDWATSWKRHFKPWVAGPGLLVRPSWSRVSPVRGQVVMTLDPGLSFGTGQHPTTRFCLKQLVRGRRPGSAQSLLDAGCGSGILAIGAALLGYSPVEAFDFDREAVRIARANARNNRVLRRIRLRHADLTREPARPARTYDIVCANLIADLLIAERRRILSRVKPGGRLIVAGILVTQFPAVERSFAREGWALVRGRTEGEWRSGMFRRRGSF
jgi:ribosomal protein L11 methyltransferase